MAIEYRTDPEYFEYLDGQAYPKVSPRLRHWLVQGAVYRILHRCGGNRGFAGTEVDLRIGAVDGTDTLFIPDIAFISAERLRALAHEDREEPPLAPDIAVEVRSPSNRERFIETKIARYLACGTLLVLDVDPATRTIVAHAAGGTQRYVTGDRFEHPAVPWLLFDVAESFADLDRLD